MSEFVLEIMQLLGFKLVMRNAGNEIRDNHSWRTN